MNIGIMQLSNGSINTKQGVKSQPTVGQSHKSDRFGEVFNKAIAATSKNEPSKTNEASAESVDLEKLEDVLSSSSVKEVLDVLGIPQEAGLLMVQAGENGEIIAMDELLDLNNLLSVLGIDQEQLLETIQQVTGVEVKEAKELWQLVNHVLSEDSKVVQQLIAALQGEHQVTPKKAEQFLQFLKLTEVAGKSSDLLGGQATTLEKLEMMLKSVVKESTSQIIQKTTENLSGKAVMQGFEQVVQRIMKTTESVGKTETTETAQTTIATASNLTNTTKTISIALPSEKGAQSEALAKEIQNLLNRSQLSNTPGTTKLLLKLYPENLGSIRIEIMHQNGVLSARLLTTTAMGKELLDSQLHQLKNAFANANIQMDRIDIAQSLQETDKNKDQNQFNQQFKQNSEQGEQRQDEQEEDSEKMSFSEYLINEEV